MKKNIVVLCFLLLSLFLTFSDVFLLKDGTTIIGKIIKRDEDTSFILTNYGEISVDNDNIQMSFLTKENYDKYITEKSENERLKKELENKTNLTEKELELEKERIRLQNEAELARIKLEQEKLEYEKTKNEITKNIEKKDLIDEWNNKYLSEIKSLDEKYLLSMHPKYDKDDKYWKRHFFDIGLIGGLSYKLTTSSDAYQSTEGVYITNIEEGGYGGNIGLSFGYSYAFNKYFALGIGFSGICSILYTATKEMYSFTSDYAESLRDSLFQDKVYNNNYLRGFIKLSGCELMLKFLMGDLKTNKIAFLMEVGVGWLFSAKLGILVKGFSFKAGYHLSGGQIKEWQMWYDGYTEDDSYKLVSIENSGNITFEFGYILNWAIKPIGK